MSTPDRGSIFEGGKPQASDRGGERRAWSVNMDSLAKNHPLYRGLNPIPGTARLTQEQLDQSRASIKDKPIKLESKGKH